MNLPNLSLLDEIRLLGDPELRKVCDPIENFEEKSFMKDCQRLQTTLLEFNKKYGFGRAISAPQIGIGKRFIALNIAGGPRFICNPQITWKSDNEITMWDDCMSFPSLLVKVKRYKSISLRFQDEKGESQIWENMDTRAAELLQHEIDHLDGVLAIDRAIDSNSIVMQEVFETMRDYFTKQVDYVIGE